MRKKNFRKSLKQSEELLSRAVSIPIFVNMNKKQIMNIHKALTLALKKSI